MLKNRQIFFDFKNCPYNKIPDSFKERFFGIADMDFDALMEYARDKNIAFFGDGHTVYFEDDTLIYVTVKGCLLLAIELKGNSSADVGFTHSGRISYEDRIRNIGEEKTMHSALMTVSFYFFVAQQILEGKLTRVKTKKGQFGRTVQAKELGNLSVRIYETDPEKEFLFADKGDGIYKIFFNGYEKHESILPDKLHPMPNKEKPVVFCRQNTEDLDDNGELAHIMEASGFIGQMGLCYQNSDTVLRILTDTGYAKEHDVQFYSGWVNHCSPDDWIHHAWIVVDGKSIIDVAHEKSGPLHDLMEKALSGEMHPTEINKARLAREIREFEAKDIPFTERFFYGTTDDWCYIGVPSNADEARDSFNRLMRDYPDHPQYQNVDKDDGSNEMNRLYYGAG